MISKTFNRYIWLLNTLLQQRRLTFEEISYRWRDNYLGDGKPLALRTFHVHREAIAELFGVEVKCDSSTYEYYISSPSQLKSDRTRQWLLNSFTVSNMIEAGHNMKDRILFEDIPEGTEFIQTVIDAMQRSKELRIDYQPFGDQRATYHLQPYAMKVYNQRWYIVGYLKEKEEIRNIALDRTLEMDLTDNDFLFPEDFDAEEYYANTVGIYVNKNLEPQKVLLRVYGIQVEYMRSLPLHFSQKEVNTKAGEYSDFQYWLSLTSELTTKILSMGEKVEVLGPDLLKKEVIRRLFNTIHHYTKQGKKIIDLAPSDLEELKFVLKINNIEKAFSKLKGRELDIMKKIYGIDYAPMSLDEIGREYGLVAERIRQIRNKAIQHLKEEKL